MGLAPIVALALSCALALAGCTVASFLGLLAVWSRQTAAAPYPGPGIGLLVAWFSVILLAYHWARVVAARSALQLATEEHRRRLLAERESRGLLDTYGDTPGEDDKPAT